MRLAPLSTAVWTRACADAGLSGQEMQNDLDRETAALQELESQKQDAQDRLEEMDQQKRKLEDMLNEVRMKCQEESQMVSEGRASLSESRPVHAWAPAQHPSVQQPPS